MATIAENIQTLRSIKSDIKNAIIQKGGSVTDAFGGYAQAITNLPSGGGGTEIEDALVTRTLSVYSNDRVSVVGNYAFYSYSNLTSISLPNCEYVGDWAFAHCASLQFIDLPNCISVNDYTFNNCESLTFFNLSNCSYIGSYAYAGCSALSSVILPLCKYVHDKAFERCSALKFVNLQNCSYVGIRALANCINLTQVYLNSVTSVTRIYSNTFYNCSNLTSIYVPSSLVNAFKTAQYWSSISHKIVAYREEIAPED